VGCYLLLFFSKRIFSSLGTMNEGSHSLKGIRLKGRELSGRKEAESVQKMAAAAHCTTQEMESQKQLPLALV